MVAAMLSAVFIPCDVPLAIALQTPSAQRAIHAGYGLYTNGRHTCLMQYGRAGWYGIAVKVKDLLPAGFEA